ncbi:MAG: RNA-binding protein [Candidatus Thermoplasmatota archaeon]
MAKSSPATPTGLRDGAACEVVDGTHKGKSGTISDLKIGATYKQVSITVTTKSGERFKTLAKNVRIL